ncbi:MAG TPA: polysaccharide pyruvyl transferase family protein [Alphaproteobacteria bacterium]|nr:polysaccharide pyruvyl transferase family protein [Alphaproteobacteria bacterium]
MTATLRLLHLVNSHSTNVGNGALADGAERVLGEDLAAPVSWSRVPWDDYTFGLKKFDRDFVGAINRSDGMIVGGAVTINGRAYLEHAGMRFDLPPALWPEIRKPLIFYGISYRHWAGQRFHHADKLRWAFDHALGRQDMLLALRNDGTREWLEGALGIASDRLHVIPDPAVFVEADDAAAAADDLALDPGRPNIVLALNDEDSAERYGTPERRMEVLRGIAQALEPVLDARGANLVLAPHYFDDHRMIADFIACCRPQLAHQRMISTGLARMADAKRFYGRYARAQLVIAMRVHAMSPSIGLGVPMIPLVTQDRLGRFLDDVGLGDLAIDALAPDLAGRLRVAIEAALDRPDELRRRFRVTRDGMRARLGAFNRKVGELLHGQTR